MSTLLSLNINNLNTVYNHLNLREKFSLCTTNKRLYRIFSNYLLTDTVYSIKVQKCLNNQFLFNNIVSLRLRGDCINLAYVKRFKNLRTVDLTRVNFRKINGAIALVEHLSWSVNTVHVSNKKAKEQFDVVKTTSKRSFKVIVSKKKRVLEASVGHARKRARTPSPVNTIIDQQLEDLLLLKSRMKYTVSNPEAFIPTIIFDKLPALPNTYDAITSFDPLPNDIDINSDSIEMIIRSLKNLLINAIVLSQQGNWILVTQVEAYYKDISFDDVSMVNKHERYIKQLKVNVEKCQEGRSTWYELRFTYDRFEMIATGGICKQEGEEKKVGAFLGVAVPSHMAHDTHFVLVAPTQPAAATSCPRMLRNYQKRASLFKWCFKSVFFENIGFSTPRSLKLYKSEPVGYIAISSRLVGLISKEKYTPAKQRKLKRMLRSTQYHKDLGLKHPLNSKKTLAALESLKAGRSTLKRKPSIGKTLLIQLLLEKHKDTIEERSIMQIYNSIIAPRIRVINQERVKELKARF